MGGEDKNRFIDKRWRRGGFVEARARGFDGSRGNESALSVMGWGVMEEKLMEGVRCEDLGLEGRAPAVEGRPGTRTISVDLEVVYWDKPWAEDGRIPDSMRSEWLRWRKLERLRSKGLSLGVGGRPGMGTGALFPSLGFAKGRGGCRWTWPFASGGGFGTGGSDFCGSE